MDGTDDRTRWPWEAHIISSTKDPRDTERAVTIVPPAATPKENAIPFAESYAEIAGQNRTGKLHTRPATIYTEYACTVLRPKGIWVVVWTVLVADLVVLRAAWAMLNWVAGRLVKTRDPEAMFCAGCATGTYQKVQHMDAEKLDNLGQTDPM